MADLTPSPDPSPDLIPDPSPDPSSDLIPEPRNMHGTSGEIKNIDIYYFLQLNNIFPNNEYKHIITFDEDPLGAGIPRQFYNQGLRLGPPLQYVLFINGEGNLDLEDWNFPIQQGFTHMFLDLNQDQHDFLSNLLKSDPDKIKEYINKGRNIMDLIQIDEVTGNLDVGWYYYQYNDIVMRDRYNARCRAAGTAGRLDWPSIDPWLSQIQLRSIFISAIFTGQYVDFNLHDWAGEILIPGIEGINPPIRADGVTIDISEDLEYWRVGAQFGAGQIKRLIGDFRLIITYRIVQYEDAVTRQIRTYIYYGTIQVTEILDDIDYPTPHTPLIIQNDDEWSDYRNEFRNLLPNYRGHELTHGIDNDYFRQGYRIFTYPTNISEVDEYDPSISIPIELTDVGIIYIPCTYTDGDGDYEDWVENNAVFISGIETAIDYTGYRRRRQLSDEIIIGNITYNRLPIAELIRLTFAPTPSAIWTPRHFYRYAYERLDDQIELEDLIVNLYETTATETTLIEETNELWGIAIILGQIACATGYSENRNRTALR